MQAVYSSRRDPRPIETASTAKEARRVLEWQQEVARSVAASEHSSPPASIISGSTATYHERQPTTYRRADSYPPVSQLGSSHTHTHERDHRPRLVRRETITTEHYRRPDEVSDTRDKGGSGFTGMKLVGTLLGAAAGAAVAYAMVRSESPPSARHAPPRRASYGDHVVERIPARSYISREQEQPPYVAQYTIAGSSHVPRRIDERSHASRRERSRSEVGTRFERPLTIMPPRDRDEASHVSHGGRSHQSYRSEEKRSHHSGTRRDDESFVSARSKRTGDVKYITASPPPSSKHSTTTIRVVPKDERRSVVSARHVPLPASRVGTYAASVAPSDSVSSVGTKRERERLRERMRERY
jgi:hypothetical protein